MSDAHAYNECPEPALRGEQPIPVKLAESGHKRHCFGRIAPSRPPFNFSIDGDMEEALKKFLCQDNPDEVMGDVADAILPAMREGKKCCSLPWSGDRARRAEQLQPVVQLLQPCINYLHFADTTVSTYEHHPGHWLDKKNVFPSKAALLKSIMTLILRWRRAFVYTTVVIGISSDNQYTGFFAIIPIALVALFVFPQVTKEIERLKAMYYSFFKLSVHVDCSNTVQPLLKNLSNLLIATSVGLVLYIIWRLAGSEVPRYSPILPVLFTAWDFYSNLTTLMNFESQLLSWSRMCEDDDFIAAVRTGWSDLAYVREWRVRVYFEARRDRVKSLLGEVGKRVAPKLLAKPEEERAGVEQNEEKLGRLVRDTLLSCLRFPVSRDDMLLFVKQELPGLLRATPVVEIGKLSMQYMGEKHLKDMTPEDFGALRFESEEDLLPIEPKCSNACGRMIPDSDTRVDKICYHVAKLYVSLTNLAIPLGGLYDLTGVPDVAKGDQEDGPIKDFYHDVGDKNGRPTKFTLDPRSAVEVVAHSEMRQIHITAVQRAHSEVMSRDVKVDV